MVAVNPQPSFNWPMPWVKIDEASPTHPKIFRAGIAAYGFDVAGLCYCNRNLTDGRIPKCDLALVFPGVSARQAVALAAKLVEVGRWREEAEVYVIHDFHEYQPSADDVRQTRETKAQVGRLGGIRSGESRRSKREADAKHDASENGSKREANDEAKTNPVPVPDIETTTDGLRSIASEPGVHEILQTYHEIFLKRYGTKPNIERGKDGAIVKRLLQRHGREKVLELLGRLFESTDPFVESSGRTIGVFAAVWNKLVTQQAMPKTPAFRPLNIQK